MFPIDPRKLIQLQSIIKGAFNATEKDYNKQVDKMVEVLKGLTWGEFQILTSAITKFLK